MGKDVRLDLSNQYQESKNFRHVDFSLADLHDTNFSGSRFENCIFDKTQCHAAQFRYCVFVDCVVIGCDFTGCDFTKADLHGIELRVNSIAGANFTGVVSDHRIYQLNNVAESERLITYIPALDYVCYNFDDSKLNYFSGTLDEFAHRAGEAYANAVNYFRTLSHG